MRTFSSVALVVAAYLLVPAMAWALTNQIDSVQVPEPGSMAMLLAALGGIAVAKFRKGR